ncbi:Retrotrans gag domain-containing protein [Abeliophyllum distichum]|uniref:Retrotrans gag domain-containing protein n=1 Tax=Abeliophyllum distichum TaxID=126358 RepID=A0ABD1PN68_9LAMI
MPEAILEENFTDGLIPEIRAEVRLMKPSGLGQIMEMAQRIEDKNLALKGSLLELAHLNPNHQFTHSNISRPQSLLSIFLNSKIRLEPEPSPPENLQIRLSRG